MRLQATIVVSLTLAGFCRAQDKPFFEVQDLYEKKDSRIPDDVVATDGSVLAVARSGRLLRRSDDGGKQPFRPCRG